MPKLCSDFGGISSFLQQEACLCCDKCSRDGAMTLLFSKGLVKRDTRKLEEQQLPRGSCKKLDGVISTSHFQLAL